jgi:catechol 2,3-dioxygenase-like lactoylglutathione lyase family enzyme
MKFSSLKPFVPSGSDFEKSKEFFVALGFTINWEEPDYVDFEKDGCEFILQRFDKPEFAQNYMLTLSVDNAEEFRDYVLDKKMPEKFGIRIGEVTPQPYGKEVNIIDFAGVCWHFVSPPTIVQV